MVSMYWQSGLPGVPGKGTRAGCCCEPDKTGHKITKTKTKTKTKNMTMTKTETRTKTIKVTKNKVQIVRSSNKDCWETEKTDG